MNKGFARQIKEKANTDEWHTPLSAVEPIIPFVKGRVWCPFDTEDSNYVKAFKAHGIDCVWSHIDDGLDFFEYEPQSYDCIISNPPYSKRNAVIKRLYELGKPFAMLLNMNGIFDHKMRFETFKNGGVQLFILNGRTKFFQKGKDLFNPPFQAIYVAHRLLPRELMFEGEKVSSSYWRNLIPSFQFPHRTYTDKKLKECPFCEYEDIEIEREEDSGLMWAICPRCGAKSAILENLERVREVWNRRGEKA